jgi:hypothetical protein
MTLDRGGSASFDVARAMQRKQKHDGGLGTPKGQDMLPPCRDVEESARRSARVADRGNGGEPVKQWLDVVEPLWISARAR